MEGYITKDQAIHAMEQVTQPECFIEDTRKDFAKIIEKLPGADVAPVVPARWERFKRTTKLNGTSLDFRCSNCRKFKFHNGELCRYKYCPECGARMDGDPQ